MADEKVFLGNTTAVIVQTVTRPSDATPYTAGDVFGTALSHIFDFADVVRAAGAAGMITTALLVDSANQAAQPSLELWLFTAAPAVQADNTPFAVTDPELANCVGVIPLTTARVGNPSAGAAGNLVIQSDVATLAFRCAGGTTHLYGVLVVRNAYTPVQNEAMTIKLAVLQDIAKAA